MFNKRVQKEHQFSKVKTSKTTQLRLSNKSGPEQNKKGRSLQSYPESNLRAVGTTVPKHQSNVNKQVEEEATKEDTIPDSTLTKNSATLENSLERSATFTTAQNNDSNNDAGIISQQELNALYNRLQADDVIVQPERVPGK